MASGVSRDRRREARWRGILGAQRRSGLSIRAFCRQIGVTESAFYFWRRQLDRRDERPGQGASGPGSPAAFVPVAVTGQPAGPASQRIEIVSPGGWRVRVGAAVDRSALVDVLAAVAGVGARQAAQVVAGVGPDSEDRPC